MKCDFEGYVTKNDIRCMDGRIIRKDAFKENDKMSVPLVWQHRHDSPENVLGHMELENREDGVYGYGFFNNTDMANTAKELVANKDIRNMSIYANHLVEKDKNVTHGSIKEVSLVLAGANPGAVINHVSIAHSDGFVTEIEDECDIFTDETILYHGDEEEKNENVEEDKETETSEEVEEVEDDEENKENEEENKENEEDSEITHSDEENQNEGDFGKAFSEMTENDYESLLADLDEMDVMLNDFDQILDGKKIRHDAFEEDEELALIHYASPYYDPKYAHEYYMAHRKLKGRQTTLREGLNKDDQRRATEYKRGLNKKRDTKIKGFYEKASTNIIKNNEKAKYDRAKLKNKTINDIKAQSASLKESVSHFRNEYENKLKTAKTPEEKARLKAEYKGNVRQMREMVFDAKTSLAKAYAGSSKGITNKKINANANERKMADKGHRDEMIKADNDYTNYLSKLANLELKEKQSGRKIARDANGDAKFGTDPNSPVNSDGSRKKNVTGKVGKPIARRGDQLHANGASDSQAINDSISASGNTEMNNRPGTYAVYQDSNGNVQVGQRVGARKRKVKHSDSDFEVLEHSDSDETVADILATLDEKQQKVAAYIIGVALANSQGKDLAQDDFEFDFEEDDNYISHEDSNETIGDIFNTFNEKQKNCIYYLVSQALEENKNIEHSDEGGNTIMKHNIFENDAEKTNVLTHDDFSEIIADAKKSGSLRDAFLAHAGEGYGFGPYTSDRDDNYDGIDVLFPDARLVDKKIEMLRNNPTDWVVKVMNGVHKSPFSRIKMIYADITGDDARAKGYVTGNQKVSEVIALLHRTTSPTTIYKLQKLDRDDIIDITDFDIVAWLKAEMRIMLEEEIARQILVGDFRSASSSDRIDPNCVRPILTDTSNDLYAMRYSYAVGQTENEYEKFIDECCLAMIDYEGTGSPTLYTTPEYVGHMLLVKDTLGNRIYKTKSELASACGVKEIVECPYMKDTTRTEDSETIHSMGFEDASGNDCLCKGIIVNLADYTVGADKGGAVNMFDDFDIDFNKYTYLIETRISGSLTKPKSAIVIGVQQA